MDSLFAEKIQPTAAAFVPALGKTVKLGMVLPKSPRRVLRLKSYLAALEAAPPPMPIDYHSSARESLNRMYLNDQYGCCVISGKAHDVGVYSANDKSPVILATDTEIFNAYNRLKAGPGDSGCVITDVLDALQSTGIVFGGKARKIDGYVGVDNTSKEEVQIALYLFGSLTIGFLLPKEWMQSAREGGIWSPTNSGIIGGHDVSIVGCNDQGVQLSTWGVVLTMTWAAFTSRTWVTECYAKLSPDWYGDDKINSATGFHAASLASDLAKLRDGTIPDVTPPNPPGPIVPPVDPPPVVPPVPVPPEPVVPTLGVEVVGQTQPVTVTLQGPLGRVYTVTIPGQRIVSTGKTTGPDVRFRGDTPEDQFGKIGDGTFAEWILKNLPAILELIGRLKGNA